MAIERRYDDLLQVTIEKEWRARVKAIADREKISEAQVVRELVHTHLPARERISTGENGSQDRPYLVGRSNDSLR